jgi:hypothetical protein
MFLTREEVKELTGYEVPGWQCKWLDAHGYRYEKSAICILRTSTKTAKYDAHKPASLLDRASFCRRFFDGKSCQ